MYYLYFLDAMRDFVRITFFVIMHYYAEVYPISVVTGGEIAITRGFLCSTYLCRFYYLPYNKGFASAIHAQMQKKVFNRCEDS